MNTAERIAKRDAVVDRAARELGRSVGRANGSWVVDGRTTADAARRLLKGWDDGDPEILDMQPSPLSGEWADGITEQDVLDEVASVAGAPVGDEARDDVIALWLEGFGDGFWDEVTRDARRIVEKEEVA